jgi:hypothetical protein
VSDAFESIRIVNLFYESSGGSSEIVLQKLWTLNVI